MAKVIKNICNTTFRFGIFSALFLSAHVPCVSAQTGSTKVEGLVVDQQTREPLIGANISIEKGITATVSDVDGKFILFLKSFPTSVSVSYLGYNTKEVRIEKGSASITVALEENAGLLDEVVIVGYGTQRRKDITGSITSLPKSVLEHVTPTFDGMLGGAVAGLNVTQNSGQPGGKLSIRIRGGNSVYASNEPLYVIDNIIFFVEKDAMQAGLNGIDGSLNPLASINPSDIESIEVLKDASAKAIYGTRGANGVILVTTKKGKRGGNAIHYQYTISADQSAKRLDLMTAKQWLQTQKDYFNNKPSMYYSPEALAQFNKGTDWQDAVLQIGLAQTHELSISGGDDKTRYLLSGSYTDRTGIIINSGFERSVGRVNLDRELFSNLTVGLTATADKSTQDALTTFEGVNYTNSPFSQGITNSLTYALYMPPVLPIYNQDGGYFSKNPFEYSYLKYYDQTANPVADLENSIGRTVNTSLMANFYARYTIIEGLTARINAGTHISYITQNYFAPPFTALGLNQDIRGMGAIGNRRTGVTQMEYLLNYTKQIHPSHFIDLLAGYTTQKTETKYAIAQANHLASFDNLAGTTKILLAPISKGLDGYLYSILGRINYSLLGRYNLTATHRIDKSSRFSAGHELEQFSSVGLSWNVHEEQFLKPISPALSVLKLRLTYGDSGNQEIGINEHDEDFNIGRYDGKPAYQLSVTEKTNLRWETTEEYNAGIDAGFWNDKLSLVADVYSKKTRDLLMQMSVESWTGASEMQTINGGSVTNKGVEFAVNAKLIDNKRLAWSVSGNIARNINTLTSMGDLGDYQTLGQDQEQILKVGESVGSFYGYIFDGIVQTGDDLSILPKVEGKEIVPGAVKLRDISGPDGKPDGEVVRDYDRTVLGSIQPDFTYGLSSSLTYRNFDFYLAFQGSQGNEVYNYLRRFLEGRSNDSYNMSAALLNAWTESNPSRTIPHIKSVRIAQLDSRFVEDASFLKLKNITLGYTLPIRIQTLPVKFRVFASAQNLITWSKYKGYDPEVASGIDSGVYPAAKTLLAGFEITF